MNLVFVGIAYLIGSIPFGYLVARAKGVDLFRVGSGNIGATNVGRVLGRKYGVLVFLLDFAKGAVTVAAFRGADGMPAAWLVAVAVAAFLGHLFPIYLGFRGGKGVATGAGVALALTPGPAVLGLATFLAMASSSRVVSLASLAATATMTLAHLIITPDAWSDDRAILSAFLVAGTLMVFVKHRANVGRLVAGTENTLSESPAMTQLSRSMHMIALAVWFGGAVFFNFIAAPSLFATFKEVVANAPSDRTANLPLAELDAGDKARLASALAGAAVGPLFPVFFGLQGVCVVIALATAIGWRYAGANRSVDRWRVRVLIVAAVAVAVSFPLGNHITELRLARLSPDTAIATAAKDAFGPWHGVSLVLSFVTAGLALAAVVMAAKLPESRASGERGV